MGRIRTIKPEFFKHEALFDAEVEAGLPLRLAFAGLWTICDKAGCFEWRPRAIKTDVLPYDEVDFSRVLDALATRGFLVRYRVDGKDFGHVPGFERHQVINNRESESKLPPPPQLTDDQSELARAPRVDDASATRHGPALAEGEGEREDISSSSSSARETDEPSDAGDQQASIVSLIPRLTHALGFDHQGITPKYWIMPDAALVVGRWRSDLKLTDEEIITVATGSATAHGSPAKGPMALDDAMARYAAAKNAPPLRPAAGNAPSKPQTIGHGIRAQIPEKYRQ